MSSTPAVVLGSVSNSIKQLSEIDVCYRYVFRRHAMFLVIVDLDLIYT
jgi:hypothetical protein